MYGNQLQNSYLENSTDREAWQATVHEVTKSQMWLSTHMHIDTTVNFLVLIFFYCGYVRC